MKQTGQVEIQVAKRKVVPALLALAVLFQTLP